MTKTVIPIITFFSSFFQFVYLGCQSFVLRADNQTSGVLNYKQKVL